MPKRRLERGYELPDVINPLTSKCVVINVPDELRHFAAFWGSLQALQYPSNWEGTPEEQEEVAQVWTQVLSTARQNWESGECFMPAQFRTNPTTGAIEYQPYGGTGWTQIGEPCACPDPNVISPPYNPDQTDPNAQACAIATNFVQWLWDKSEDTADTFEAAADTISFLDTIGIVFPPAYLLGDQITDIFNELAEAGVNLFRAWLSTERKETHQEWFYCELQSISPPEISQTLWDEYKEWVSSDEPDSPGKGAYQEVINALKFEAIEDRSRISSYGAGNCAAFDCGGEWEVTWDFTGTSGSPYWAAWVVSGAPLSEYVSGQGWKSKPYAPLGNAELNSIVNDPNNGALTRITHVRVTGLTPEVASGGARGIVLNGAFISLGSPTAVEQEYLWDGDEPFNTLRVAMDTNIETPLKSTITLVTLRGTGVNPFE